MKEYIHYFENQADFEAHYYGEAYDEPFVGGVLTGATGSPLMVKYNKTKYEKMLETPLTFEILSAGTYSSITWSYALQDDDLSYARTIKYKINDGSWTSLNSSGGPEIQVSAGDIIQIVGDNSYYAHYNSFPYGGSENVLPNFYSHFTCDPYDDGGLKIKAYGNIMSLIDSTDFATLTSFQDDVALAFIFHNFKGLVDVSDLVLPATGLTKACYCGLFQECTSLVNANIVLPAPKVPAIGYANMFASCTSLLNGPEVLPATEIEMGAYSYMFNGDLENQGTSCPLRSAPKIMATAFTSFDYYDEGELYTQEGTYTMYYMFCCCTAITTAPALLTTALTFVCYNGMFAGCTSLTTAPVLPAMTLADNCYEAMFTGCTSLTVAQQILPATALTIDCYHNMFSGCTSLTTAPELPATSVYPNGCCYQEMFIGCSSLSYVKCMVANPGHQDSLNSFYDWLTGVSQTGTFVKNSQATNWPSGANGIPTGWTVVDA